jgi:hypothetical protein
MVIGNHMSKITVGLIAALFLVLFLTPRSADAYWGFSAGAKFYFEPTRANLFRFQIENIYKIVGPLALNVGEALEINGDRFMSTTMLGLMTIFSLGVIQPMLRADFIFDGGTIFRNNDGFYGLGGLFGTGLYFNLKVVTFTLEANFEIGKFIGYDQGGDRSPLFWGLNLMAGVLF